MISSAVFLCLIAEVTFQDKRQQHHSVFGENQQRPEEVRAKAPRM